MKAQGRLMVTMGMLLAPLSLVALGACVGTTIAGEAPATGVAVTGDQIVLGGARGFAAAEELYIAAANGAKRLADRGTIRGAQAKRLRAINARARTVLVTGKLAVDTVAKARAAAELFGAIDAITAIREGR